MNKLLTKKNVLTISGISSFVLLILNQIGTDKLCGGVQYRDCMHMVFQILILLFPIIPFFIFSLITYKLRDEIFQAWIIFAKWWIPLTIALVLLAPATDGSLLPIDKGRVSLFMNVLFLIISLLIIGIKTFVLRKK